MNSFNFKNYEINFQIPSRPNFTTKFFERRAVEAYHTLFSEIGIHFLYENNSISRDVNGYILFTFDLTSNLSANCGHWNLVKHGNLRLEVRFEKALSVIINCIIYAEFDMNVLVINSSRQIIVDFFD